jgi:hypothetical protein
LIIKLIIKLIINQIFEIIILIKFNFNKLSKKASAWHYICK